MNASTLAVLRVRLASDRLTTADALQCALVQLIETPEDSDSIRWRALIRETGDAVAELCDGWHLTISQVASHLGLDDHECVPFFRGIAHVLRLADESGIELLSLVEADIAHAQAVANPDGVKKS